MASSNWDGTGWFVGGGAEHSGASARLIAFLASGGNEGIIGSKDLQVAALATPGAGVRVFPGACSILNRQANTRYESYAERLLAQDTVAIAATGGTARNDMVIARVENPYTEPAKWNQYTNADDIKNGPYVFTRVLPNIGGATRVQDLGLGYSAIELARVEVPANTSVITQAMIRDLRRMTQTFRYADTDTFQPTSTQEIATAGYTTWAGIAKGVPIPAWATHFSARAILAGVVYGNRSGQSGFKNPSMYARLVLTQGGTTLAGDGTGYSVEVTAGTDFFTAMTATKAMPIPAASRGKDATLNMQAYRTSPVAQGSFWLGTASTVTLDIEFEQRPEAN